MWSILGYLIFFNAVQGTFSEYIEGNIPYNITIKSSNDNFKWTKDGTEILTVFFNNASNDCYLYPPVQDYKGYCMRDGGDVKYVLEILNTSLHDEAVFTGPQTIQVKHVGASYSHLSGSILTDQQPIDIECGVNCTKPEPKFGFNITIMNWTVTITPTPTSESCNGNILVKKAKNYHVKASLGPSILKQNFPSDVDWIKDIENITVKIYFIYDGRTSEIGSKVIDFVYLGPHGCCCYCYCLVLLIIKVVLVVVTIILVIVHFCRREAKADGNFYWVITVGFILDGPVCFVLSIIQILYFKHIIACSQCMDKPGYDAAIAFDVCGFITSIVCIVFFWIRLKQRDQSKKVPVSTTEMNLNPEKEGTGTRPLPTPKNT